MDQRGWSIGTLSDRSGVDKGHLSVMLRGRVPNPGTVTLGKIANALGVSLSEITGEKPMPKRRAEIFEGVARVPVMRVRVQASGSPAWDDTRENIYVSAGIAAGRPNIRAAIVTGECMSPHVAPGDRVVFDPDGVAKDRDMVIVTTEDGDVLVKWFRVDPLGRPYLRAADGTEIRPNGAKIEGVVLTTERRALRDPE